MDKKKGLENPGRTRWGVCIPFLVGGTYQRTREDLLAQGLTTVKELNALDRSKVGSMAAASGSAGRR